MYLKESKIIVIKIGSSLLIDDKKKIRKKWLTEFSKDIQSLIKQNKKVIIVSSGAIAMGCKKLNLSKKNLKLDKSQAVASIGQIELMNLFSEIFVKSKINISQKAMLIVVVIFYPLIFLYQGWKYKNFTTKVKPNDE